MAKSIEVDIELCMGCKSCELECAIAHSRSKDLATTVKNEEKPGYRINVESYGKKAIPVNCKHCDEPACVFACPTGAVYRDKDGEPVIVDPERCIGCKMCVQACPFGVITMNSEGKGVLKCDLCIDRLEKGLEPACVSACPTKALVYTDEEESNRAKRKKVAMRLVSGNNDDN
jgi:carbon-monoxide dehydrogenase iron sulfur subunit